MNHLLTINSVAITDDGRTFDEATDLRMVQNELADGSLRRYNKGLKKARKKYNFSWDWCPSSDAVTSDKKAGRTTLRSLVNTTDAVTVTVTVNGQTTTTVCFMESYSEKLLRRDIVSGIDFYQISLSLVEI